MSNTFWVYINFPNDKAFVHLSTCSHCNDGQGREQDRLDHNGEWLGSFDRETAIDRARNSGRRNRRWCGFCAKKLNIKVDLEI